MSVSDKPSLKDSIATLDREIEHLQAQLEARQAVRAQLQSELALSRLFPARSGFVRE